MPAFYIWDGINIPILQPHLFQRKDQCSFCATSRQIEYSIRIAWAKAEPPSRLGSGRLVDQEAWQDLLNTKFPERKKWNPGDLLNQALGEDHNNPNGEKRYGCVLVHRAYHYINVKVTIPKQALNVLDMRKLFDANIPVIAVIDIKTDYPSHGENPYLGKGEQKWSVRKKKETHAVVLVGEYIAEENDQFGLEQGVYWIYQNSPPKGLPDKDSLLSNGLSILHPSVVNAAFYGISYPPAVLATPVVAKQIKEQQERVTSRRRIARESLKKLESSNKRPRN